MSCHIRTRPTALIISEGKVLLIEYQDKEQLHYNLPGGGAEPGEAITESLRRELLEEASIEINIGPVAFVYEYFPNKQSGDYESSVHGLHIIFDCEIKEGFTPKLPDHPDSCQVGVKWIAIEELESVILYPNIKKHIKEYSKSRRNIDLIEDHQLESYKQIDYELTKEEFSPEKE
ncbi:NUDIX domain-containing protein [Paenibacillus caui]|uniref:NUDIX domain-containing protein n=1 Tax=Paenibacillus caui TaxID=2873927 RepID=UPI001CA9B2F8|nr:NUDIX domain-containing protein [Paenibacillus caui]